MLDLARQHISHNNVINCFFSNRNTDICSAVVNLELLPQDHSLLASNSLLFGIQHLAGKWQTMTKIKRESKKTFEHLLFICCRTMSQGEDSGDKGHRTDW